MIPFVEQEDNRSIKLDNPLDSNKSFQELILNSLSKKSNI